MREPWCGKCGYKEDEHPVKNFCKSFRLADGFTPKYMIVWWLAPMPGSPMTPYYALFNDAEQAIEAAKTRNALFVSWMGSEPLVHDYKYRDEDGKPMPAQRRELVQAFVRGGLATLRHPA